jgi:peptidoglycan/xylan/chitin deacetylase (PgdA/CDA1 family)
MLKLRCVSAEEGLSSPTGHNFLLTIDGGLEDLHAELLPMLRPYELKPLLFLVVDQIGGFNAWESTMGYRKQKLLSVEQVREMQRYGIEFGSHTCSHPWLPSLSDNDLQKEVKDSKQKLEDLLGVEVTKFAYPYGGANARVRAMVARAGYKWAFSTSPGLSFWDDPLWIKRVEVADSDSLFGLLVKVLTGKSVSQRSFEQLTRLRDWAENAHKPD